MPRSQLTQVNGIGEVSFVRPTSPGLSLAADKPEKRLTIFDAVRVGIHIGVGNQAGEKRPRPNQLRQERRCLRRANASGTASSTLNILERAAH